MCLHTFRIHFTSSQPCVRNHVGSKAKEREQNADSYTEIFLPSYADYHFDDLERRQDPVQDIILTDEEVKNMFPS